jgi:hypothetical protein
MKHLQHTSKIAETLAKTLETLAKTPKTLKNMCVAIAKHIQLPD